MEALEDVRGHSEIIGKEEVIESERKGLLINFGRDRRIYREDHYLLKLPSDKEERFF